MRDTTIFDLIAQERQRQVNGIELIASENFASEQVMEAQGSVLTNKYAEGYPGKRYYGGCEIVDIVEDLARDRAKELYGAAYVNDSAEVALSWEKTRVSFEVKVPTEKLAMTSIEKVLAGPAAGDFFSAASYYYQSNIENEKALTWVNKALELSPKDKDLPFWYLRLKSLIQARAGDKKGAIATAKESLANAVKAGNGDYERMNKASIAEWSK